MFYAWPNRPYPVISVAPCALYFFINEAAYIFNVDMCFSAYSYAPLMNQSDIPKLSPLVYIESFLIIHSMMLVAC